MTTNFDIDALRAVVFGIEQGSFARAAVELGRSQSAVSMNVEYRDNRQIFTFTTQRDGETAIISFGGHGPDQFHPGPDDAVQPIDKVIFTFQGSSDHLAAKGTCSFSNPYRGVPAAISCMAAAAGLSPRQLQRTLKRTTGLAPHDFLKVLRLQQALRGEPSLSYADQSHFIHSFRKATGYTPGRYSKKFDV